MQATKNSISGQGVIPCSFNTNTIQVSFVVPGVVPALSAEEEQATRKYLLGNKLNTDAQMNEPIGNEQKTDRNVCED